MSTHGMSCYFAFLAAVVPVLFGAGWSAADDNPFGLNLPDRRVAERVTITRGIKSRGKETLAELDGPGCIRHIWIAVRRSGTVTMVNRKIVMRIYFDGATVPYVEAPVGDFFGVMHGVDWYDVNTPLLSVTAWSGYNCYFAMPFARSARIEFETGEQANHVYLQVDWHRYPDDELKEPRRFCARWRRECPTQRYGEDYLMLDADGPGQLVGFVYGVRLMDDTDRWSHGGSENVYIDGDGNHPTYIRGIGGEDTFGTSYGGALHPPETHLYAGMPYYTHEDVGEARPAQRLVGYRFFIHDAIPFEKSIHIRFGCMENDICSTVYWYQTGTVRPFVKMPDFPKLLPGTELKRGSVDLALPNAGSWWVTGPLEYDSDESLRATLAGVATAPAHESGRQWTRRAAIHGFIDFNHLYRPQTRGVATYWSDKAAVARCVLRSPESTTAALKLAWDDHLVLQVNGRTPLDLGTQPMFREKTVNVDLEKGTNTIRLLLTNTRGTNHGGWAFAFQATTPDGTMLLPQAD